MAGTQDRNFLSAKDSTHEVYVYSRPFATRTLPPALAAKTITKDPQAAKSQVLFFILVMIAMIAIGCTPVHDRLKQQIHLRLLRLLNSDSRRARAARGAHPIGGGAGHGVDVDGEGQLRLPAHVLGDDASTQGNV